MRTPKIGRKIFRLGVSAWEETGWGIVVQMRGESLFRSECKSISAAKDIIAFLFSGSSSYRLYWGCNRSS